jgi:hypothetical protein
MSSPANSTLHNWRIRSVVNTKLNLLRAGAQAPAKLFELARRGWRKPRWWARRGRGGASYEQLPASMILAMKPGHWYGRSRAWRGLSNGLASLVRSTTVRRRVRPAGAPRPGLSVS